MRTFSYILLVLLGLSLLIWVLCMSVGYYTYPCAAFRNGIMQYTPAPGRCV